MSRPGPVFHPKATGDAAQTVTAHAKLQEIILWAGWFCPFTQRVWAVLEEKEIAYQYKEVNPYLKEASFLAVNPKGLVPVLEVNSGPICDSWIICEYLEDAFPNQSPHLLPKDPYERSIARTGIDFINKSVVPAFFRLLQAQPEEPEKQALALAELNKVLGSLSEKRKGPFYFGDDISLVDIFIVPWAVRDFMIRDYRGFKRSEIKGGWAEWARLLEVHPSVVKTASDRKYYIEFNQTFLKNESHSAPGIAARTGQAIP